jgi:hypothetical protein
MTREERRFVRVPRARPWASAVLVALALALTGVLLWTTPAHAFEKQWHVGGGVGAASPSEHAIGPAFNLYGAYGLSDVFDVRLEAFASTHAGFVPDPANPEDAGLRRTWPAIFYGGKLALAYKVDVIEWIPYLGVTGGFLGVAPRSDTEGEEAKARPFAPAQLTAGGVFGLDYAVTREFGLGLAVFGDYAFGGGNGLYGAAFLRAEYRFGW